LIGDSRELPLIRLTISDWTEKNPRISLRRELQQVDRARWRFYRLWGDLLQEAANRAVEELRSVVNGASEN